MRLCAIVPTLFRLNPGTQYHIARVGRGVGEGGGSPPLVKRVEIHSLEKTMCPHVLTVVGAAAEPPVGSEFGERERVEAS